jgi:hypothetical protein
LLQARWNFKDYPWTDEQSTEQVYIEAFYLMAYGDMSFKMLSMAPPDPQSSLSLPSWCLDFHRARDRERIYQERFGEIDRDWRASRRTQRINRGRDASKLRLNGIRVSTVVAVLGSWAPIYILDETQTEAEVEAKVSANTE